MAYGDHIIVTPFKRWCILVAYWAVLATFVIPRGYLAALYHQEWKPLNAVYLASLIVQVPIFLSLWTFAAYAFNRPWSLFATIVYPIGHIIDSLMWYAVFDMGKAWSSSSSSSSSMTVQYFAGYFVLSLFVFAHRKTFEVWYLPEHHPPRDVRGGLWYVIAAVTGSFFFAAIYHWYGDLKWCVLVKYIIDLYCCIRMRLPAPWMPYSNEHEKDKRWDWAGF
jgi:hypothetical protein